MLYSSVWLLDSKLSMFVFNVNSQGLRPPVSETGN